MVQFILLFKEYYGVIRNEIMGPCIPTPEAAEMKPYTFRYSVLPHEEGWRENTTYRHAMEFNMPLIAIHLGGREALQLITLKYDSNKVRSEGYHHSFLEIEPKNVVLSTLKLGEHNVDGGDHSLVVRIYETEGIDENEVRLIFFKKIKSASIIDLLENRIQEIPTFKSDNTREKNSSMSESFNDNTIMIRIGAFKIVSLRVNF